MKQLEISRLMDEYVDTEFFPEGGSAADADAVKARVLAQAAPAKRRRAPLKLALLAAALAVGCALCIAATVGGPVIRYLSGASFENGIFDSRDAVPPMVVEDGRVWFTADGQHTDITDLIDANTPYLYTYTDPETMAVTHTAVGGTMEDLGWFEYALWNNNYGDAGQVGGNYYTMYVTIDGVTYPSDELTPEQEAYLHSLGEWPIDIVYRPWALSAAHQLGIGIFD